MPLIGSARVRKRVDPKQDDPEKASRAFVRYRKGPSTVAESESLLQPHLKREDDEEQEDVKLLRDKYSKDLMRSKYGTGAGSDAFFELDEGELGKLRMATSISSVKGMTRAPQTVLPAEDFQLVVTIVDGRKIEGSNPNPYIFINCAGEERVTEIQYGTPTPYFNQVYVIDFNMPTSQILDQVLVLTVRLVSSLPPLPPIARFHCAFSRSTRRLESSLYVYLYQ